VRNVYAYADSSEWVSEYTKTEYDRTPTLPFFAIESTFENEHSSTMTLLASQSLWLMLGGGAGANFGNYPVWHFEAGWTGSSGIGSPGSIQQGRIGDLVRSRAWWRFVPDYSNTVVTAGRGSLSSAGYVPASRTSDGETVMAYVPGGNAITVDMSKISGSDVKAWWFNPASGASTLIGIYPASGARNFTPPGNSYVLVLDRASAGLAAPGTTVYGYVGAHMPSPPPPFEPLDLPSRRVWMAVD
jgi:hypothetical protein